MMAEAAPGARSAGLVKECVAIRARYRRHKQAWQPHLEHCKAHIVRAIKAADPAKPILVLGAGPCLDLPIEALAGHRGGATLVDAVLLPDAKKIMTKNPRLNFVLSDITGLLAKGRGEMEIPVQAPIDVAGYGLIISANILSQLPLSFAFVPPQTDDDKAIIKALQMSHVNLLKASGVPALVISDYKVKISLPTGINEYNALDSAILAGDLMDSWQWPVAPWGELGAQKDVCLTVGVWQVNWEYRYARDRLDTHPSG